MSVKLEKSSETIVPEVDVAENRYPYCIVWSPLPLITWLIPFIGHLGIADSRGVIYDFAGPYTIGEEHMAFGKPTRYLQLNPNKTRGNKWDEVLEHKKLLVKTYKILINY